MSYSPLAADVKKLREQTGAGVMDCKRALAESEGDFDKAHELIKAWGLEGVQKRAGRVASEGLVEAYLHQPSSDLPAKVGVLVELNCETDFVAKSPEFKELARHLAVHVAGMFPKWRSREDMSEAELEEIRGLILTADPDADVEKKLTQRLSEPGGSLTDQEFPRDPSNRTIGEIIQEFAAKVKENVTVGRIARFKVGEEQE